MQHLIPWDAGGTTDLANLVLLCRRHHVAVHEGRKRLLRADEGSCRACGKRRHHERLGRGDPDG